MAALLMGPEQRAQLAELRERAEQHPVDMLTAPARLASYEGKRNHMVQMNAQTVVLPVNVMVTFSVEIGHPGGSALHMSISIEQAGKLPAPELIWMVAEELGFRGGLEACDKVWPERLQGRDGIAINVAQLCDTAEAAERPPS